MGAGTVDCPQGKVAIGGGANVTGGTPGTSYIQRNGPVDVSGYDDVGQPTGYALPVDGERSEAWEFRIVNGAGAGRSVIGYVICAKPAT